MGGILTVWNNCLDRREADYEEWYQGEHLADRVRVPGFRVGRRYEALAASRRYLTTYEVDSPAVLTSDAYTALLRHPTPRTTAIMQDGFTDMRRTVCERRRILGAFRGAVVVTAALTTPEPFATLRAIADGFPLDAALAHSEIWISAEPASNSLSVEETIRGRDAKVSGCLTLEFLREAPARACAAALVSRWPDADLGVYRLLSCLTQEQARHPQVASGI